MTSFTIPSETVERQVGRQRLLQLFRLIRHLREWRLKDEKSLAAGVQLPSAQVPINRGHIDLCTFRFAPSIIVRSEAELFGLSHPRFAIRADLPDDLGFVNLRRVEKFYERCAQVEWVDRPEHRVSLFKEGKKYTQTYRPSDGASPQDVVKANANCIADSVLGIPRHAASAYHVVGGDLSAAYGEPGPRIGTSFVNHVILQGGGLCAQATCFMAAALMSEHIQLNPDGNQCGSVHGIAEITAIANDRDDNNAALSLQGLTFNRITSYFKQIGLTVPMQRVSDLRSFGGGELRKEIFRRICRSYLLSGVPVILNTCLERQPWHDSESDFVLTEAHKRSARPDHAVLIVGCGLDGSGFENRLLVHDPNSLPYIEAESDLLFKAAERSATIPAEPLKRTQHARGAVAAVFDKLLSHLPKSRTPFPFQTPEAFWAVTPPGVHLTLEGVHLSLDDSETSRPQFRLGLFDIAYTVQLKDRKGLKVDDMLPFEGMHFQSGDPRRGELGEFRLVDLSQLGMSNAEVPSLVRILGVDGVVRLRKIAHHLTFAKARKWVWIQRRNRSQSEIADTYIWDAGPVKGGEGYQIMVQPQDYQSSLQIAVVNAIEGHGAPAIPLRAVISLNPATELWQCRFRDEKTVVGCGH